MILKEIVINADPEKIWPYLVEPEKILTWCFTLEKFEYTSSQKEGKYSSFRYVDKGSVHTFEIDFIINEWIDNEVISFTMVSGDHFKSYEGKWSISAEKNRSKFCFMEKTTMPYGIFGKLYGIFSERRASAVVENMLESLKNNVENSV